MDGIKILSTGYYAPSKILDNFDLEKMVETSDEWIVSRTGIERRHICETEDCTQMAYLAAVKAIEKVDKDKIGLIICATMTPDYFTPSTACLLQEKLGLNDHEVMCFDLSAACSGFVYALTTAQALLKGMPDKYALVVGSEEISKIIDFTDRNTCVLFGDGAGAVVVSNGDGMFASYCNSAGNIGALCAPAINKQDENHFLTMAGQEVFKFAVKVIPESINAILDKTGLSFDDIDYVVCHQANYRIIRNVYKKMKADPNKFYMNLQEYGNTSAASIPLALGEMDANGLLKAGDKIICVGFGGGLTWGATLIEWS
ncbi:beta-ketoacyl-ACP synthase III [uncultured Thomasclavelia sp.]|uniref:beta-ketoacyl-ACP synthase III n=1 Tax=uncultured Thomasclavelia sp. TaxID=3025759 RepID=UPI0025F01485|nr:beta-ketoacyl-ACP synthase III [uncultured Thomasclavelia sp.]